VNSVAVFKAYPKPLVIAKMRPVLKSILLCCATLLITATITKVSCADEEITYGKRSEMKEIRKHGNSGNVQVNDKTMIKFYNVSRKQQENHYTTSIMYKTNF
jgi:hypothetical protein